MLQSFLKTALRGLLRHPLFAAINIVGLAGGMACSLLIFAYVQHELSFEGFNGRAERLYRLMSGDRRTELKPRVADLLTQHVAAVEGVARLAGSGLPLLTSAHHQGFHRVVLGDSALPELLGLPFVSGDRATALAEPYRMIISERIARQFFGDRDPVGETMRWDAAYDFQISGVFENRSDTHFDHELVMSMPTAAVEPGYGPQDLTAWHARTCWFYVLVAPEASQAGVADSLLAVLSREGPDWVADAVREQGDLHLQAVADVHLDTGGQRQSVHLLAVIGVFVLIVACVNFVNLSTASSARRVKEVGIRKAVGVGQGHLASQFLVESGLQVLVATTLGVLLAWACSPAFESLTGFAPRLLASGTALWAQVAGLLAVVVLGAGYPAFVLVRLDPTRVLRDARATGSMGAALRRRLVELQFALAFLLCLGTTVVHQQLGHLRGGSIGFDREQVLTFKMGYKGVGHTSMPMMDSMSHLPGVVGVAGHSDPPLFDPFMNWNHFRTTVEGRADTFRTLGTFIDGRFVETMGLDLLAGRSPRMHLPNADREFVVNETAVQVLGLGKPADAIGQAIRVGWQRGAVVGVVRDFHYQTRHAPIEPLAMASPGYDNRTSLDGSFEESYNNYIVRVEAGALPGVLDRLTEVWRSYVPHFPFPYHFIDETFEARHRREDTLSTLMGWFAGTTLLLTGLGVFAMAAYEAQHRTKEIGVRKVLGASQTGILVNLARDFAHAFAVSAVVAMPIGLLAATRWLEAYPYHVRVGLGVVAFAGVVVAATAAVAMAHQVWSAARLDPVEALRYE